MPTGRCCLSLFYEGICKMGIPSKINRELNLIIYCSNNKHDFFGEALSEHGDSHKKIFCDCGGLSTKLKIRSLADMYSLFIDKPMGDFEKYAGRAYSVFPWGESIFHDDFMYFSNSPNIDSDNKNRQFDKAEAHLTEDSCLLVKTSSLNLSANAFRWQNVFLRQIEEIKKNYDKETFEIRKFIIAYCRAVRTHINNKAQFTYLGERFIIPESSWSDGANGEGFLRAVRFKNAGTLSSIDSARLLEKVWHCISMKKRREAKGNSGEKSPHIIQIAVFGEFSDKPKSANEKHHIEMMADKGFFCYNEDNDKGNNGNSRNNSRNDGNGENGWRRSGDNCIKYDVKITYFEIVKSDFAVLQFKETACGEKIISGNLYDVNFLNRVCEKYDMVCLLDMGCFYADTSRITNWNGESPAEAVRNLVGSIKYRKNHDGIENVSMESYEALYNSYLKWIEYEFYGQNHSYEFDPRLFAALNTLSRYVTEGTLTKSGDAGKYSAIYSFISHDRGRAFSAVKEYQDLCKGEFYNGQAVVVYDWGRIDYSSGDGKAAIDERNKALLGEDCYTAKYLLPVRLWKIVKSLGDDFFYKQFVNQFTDNGYIDSENSEPDFDFVDYLRNSYLIFDYSNIKNAREIYYGIKHYPTKKNEKPDCLSVGHNYHNYQAVSVKLVKGVIRLAFDSACYENCASDYCRNVIINAMITDSISAEHLLLTYFINRQPPWNSTIKFIYKEFLNDIREPESLIYEKYRLNQCDNLAIFHAITHINRTDYRDFKFAADNLQYYLPKPLCTDMNGSENGSRKSNRPSGAKLLGKMGETCKKLGFTDCEIYRCAIQPV